MASSISNENGHTNGSESGPSKKQRQVRSLTKFFMLIPINFETKCSKISLLLNSRYTIIKIPGTCLVRWML